MRDWWAHQSQRAAIRQRPRAAMPLHSHRLLPPGSPAASARERAAGLQSLDAVARESSLVDVEAKAGPLWHHAFTVGVVEWLFAMEQRKKCLAIVVRQEWRR